QPFVSTHFKVTGESNGCSTAAQYYVDVRHCTGVEEHSELYSIFPNPASNHLILQKDNKQKCEVKIYENSGKLMRTEFFEGDTHNIDISALSAGSYQLQVFTTSKKLLVFRFIKR